MPVAISELRDVELSEVKAAVGSTSFTRGRTYARGKRVVAIEWDPSGETLTGSVVGNGALYDTAAFFVKILGLLDDFDRNRFTILRSITLLRQLSLHAGLVDDANDAVPCAKLGALVEQLSDVVGGGHRALVFSQFTGFLAKVRDRLDCPVMVYRVIARDTIEEKVAALARRKAALFSGVMDDGDMFASTVTAEDIRGLLW